MGIITVKTWDEKNYLTMDDSCFTMQMGKERKVIPLDQVVSLEITDPKGKMRPGMIEIRLAGTSNLADRASAWVMNIGKNSIGFPHSYAYISAGQAMQRQFMEYQRQASQPAVQQISSADELRKFKELLDIGVITQAEFDAKKKQLLGI